MLVNLNVVNNSVNPSLQIEDELTSLNQLAQEYAKNPSSGLAKEIKALQDKIASQCAKLPASERPTLDQDLKYLNMIISRLEADVSNQDAPLVKNDLDSLNVLIDGRFCSYLTNPNMRADQSILQDLDLIQMLLMDANDPDADPKRIAQDTDLINQLMDIAGKKISGLNPSIQSDAKELMSTLQDLIDDTDYNAAYGCIVDLKQVIDVAITQ